MTLSGGSIYISDAGFSCDGGELVQYEKLKTAVRFYYGGKHITLGPKEYATLAGYRFRVGLANSKRATFTMEKVKKLKKA